MKKIIFTFNCLIFFVVCSFSTASATIRNCAIQLQTQLHSNWCWAACSETIVEYYGTQVAQCWEVNYAFTRNDCCGNIMFYWNHICNSGNSLFGASGSISDILSNWNVNNSGYTRNLTWTEVQTEINNYRPFVIRWGWYGGGGHFLVGYGYNTAGQGWCHYMDPWPGEGLTWITYNNLVDDGSEHSWTHSLTTN